MRVNIYAVDQVTDAATLEATGDLDEFLDIKSDPDVEAELAEFGVAWVGGGAAQLYRIEVVHA